MGTDSSSTLARFLRNASAIIAALVLSAGLCRAQGGLPGFVAPMKSASTKNAFAEARTGYLWGVNEMTLRDGDNPNHPPADQEVGVRGPLFGLHGQAFPLDDLAVRAGAWINIPIVTRSDFYLDRTARGWDSGCRYFSGDASVVYHVGPSVPSFTAGLIGGYRYTYFDTMSRRTIDSSETIASHLHVHTPYVGVHYANTAMFGSELRLDVIISPLALAKLDWEQNRQQTVTRVDGHSITGTFFESCFVWSWFLSRSVTAGLFLNYTYLELSGGATKTEALTGSTRFSMDADNHLFLGGLTISYGF